MTRVIAGEFKGHRLAVAPNGVRPTSDRVREAIFSSLVSKKDIVGQRVLDLYAGTGALAIEAISRGVAYAVLVERDRKVLAVTKANLTKLGLENRAVQVLADVNHWVRQSRELSPEQNIRQAGFDLIFMDPPYEKSSADVSSLIIQLLEGKWLAANGVLVVERATKSSLISWPAGIDRIESGIYRDTTVWYGQFDG